jgi:hypothetical protein
MKESALDLLMKRCLEALAKEPVDATEKEKGYSVALRHIISILEDQYKQIEQDQMANQYKKGFDEGTELLYKEVRRIYDKNKILYGIYD